MEQCNMAALPTSSDVPPGLRRPPFTSPPTRSPTRAIQSRRVDCTNIGGQGSSHTRDRARNQPTTVDPVEDARRNQRRRNAFAADLAQELFTTGRTLFPEGVPESEGACASTTTSAAYQDCFRQAYIDFTQPSRFDTVTSSFVQAGGWQSLLGPQRTALLHALRSEMRRNPRNGAYQKTVMLSQPELAARCGVCVKTIQRWLEPGPSLDVLLQKQNAAAQYTVRAGQLIRRKVSKAALQNAFLRLFIVEIEPTGYTKRSSTGPRYQIGRNKYHVLPIDPLLPGQAAEFFDHVRALTTPHQADLPTDRCDCMQPELPFSSAATRYATVPSCDEPQDIRASNPTAFTTVATRQPPPAEVTTKCLVSRLRRSDKMSWRNYRRSTTDKRERFRALSRRLRMVKLSESGLIPEPANPVTETQSTFMPSSVQDSLSHTESVYQGSAHKPTMPDQTTMPPHISTAAGTFDVVWHLHRDEWRTSHAREIAAYADLIDGIAQHVSATLNDQAPRSTRTRMAALLCGAAIPCEYDACADVLYAAQAQSRSSGNRVRCKRDTAGNIRAVPLFFRTLQAMLGACDNPAYYPDPSERRMRADISNDTLTVTPSVARPGKRSQQPQQKRSPLAPVRENASTLSLLSDASSTCPPTDLLVDDDVSDVCELDHAGSGNTKSEGLGSEWTPQLHAIWQDTLRALRVVLTPAQFDASFYSTSLRIVPGSHICLCIPSRVAGNMVERRYRDAVIQALMRVSRGSIPLEWIRSLVVVTGSLPSEFVSLTGPAMPSGVGGQLECAS